MGLSVRHIDPGIGFFMSLFNSFGLVGIHSTTCQTGRRWTFQPSIHYFLQDIFLNFTTDKGRHIPRSQSVAARKLVLNSHEAQTCSHSSVWKHSQLQEVSAIVLLRPIPHSHITRLQMSLLSMSPRNLTPESHTTHKNTSCHIDIVYITDGRQRTV